MPPTHNPRAERNELVQFVASLPSDAIKRLHMSIDDNTYQAALDYLDPDYATFFIGSKTVRQALVIGCKAHITATYC